MAEILRFRAAAAFQDCPSISWRLSDMAEALCSLEFGESETELARIYEIPEAIFSSWARKGKFFKKITWKLSRMSK